MPRAMRYRPLVAMAAKRESGFAPVPAALRLATSVGSLTASRYYDT